MTLVIENFRDHPARKYESLQRIHFFEGKFLLSDAANLFKINLLSLDTGNLGEPYESLVTLHYTLADPDPHQTAYVIELEYDSAAELAVFCKANQIELEISTSLSLDKKYIKRLKWHEQHKSA